MNDEEALIGLSPSADSPAQKRRKVLVGRGALM
jgi:hypothetical protein